MRKKAHGLKYIDMCIFYIYIHIYIYMCIYIYTYIYIYGRVEKETKICPGMKINKMGIMIILERKKRKYDQRT